MLHRDIDSLGDVIVNRLLARDEVEERRSRFADRPALFFRGREFFHLDEPGLADVRLGRESIRVHRAGLRADPRVELRGGSSEWVHIRFRSEDDVEAVLKWSELVLGAEA